MDVVAVGIGVKGVTAGFWQAERTEETISMISKEMAGHFRRIALEQEGLSVRQVIH